jgi:hypothetical protein
MDRPRGQPNRPVVAAAQHGFYDAPTLAGLMFEFKSLNRHA